MPPNSETKLCANEACPWCVIYDSSIGKADLDLYRCLFNPELQVNANSETVEKINRALTDQARAVLTTMHTWPPKVK